eukprot:RCo006720
MSSLECPICMERYNTGNRQCFLVCSQGHCVCQGCRGGLQSCPVCRGPLLPGGGFVNRLVSGIADEMDKETGDKAPLSPPQSKPTARGSPVSEAEQVKLKVQSKAGMRSFLVRSTISMEGILRTLREEYGPFDRITYEDGEGDLVSLESDDDLALAFDYYRGHLAAQGKGLRLTVIGERASPLAAPLSFCSDGHGHHSDLELSSEGRVARKTSGLSTYSSAQVQGIAVALGGEGHVTLRILRCENTCVGVLPQSHAPLKKSGLGWPGSTCFPEGIGLDSLWVVWRNGAFDRRCRAGFQAGDEVTIQVDRRPQAMAQENSLGRVKFLVNRSVVAGPFALMFPDNAVFVVTLEYVGEALEILSQGGND